FVVEWDGTGFGTVSEGDSRYYRVINMPDRGPVLLGQKGRREDIFVPGVYEMAWRNGEYESEQRLTLPKRVNIFGFAIGDVMNNGEQTIAVYDAEDHILLYNQSGEEQWKSADKYGGSMNYLEFSMHGSNADDMMDRLYLPQRIFIGDVDGDGKNEVIVSSNKGALGRLMSHLRRFSSGQIESLAWNDLGLALNRHTPKTSGYISDYAVGDFDHDGRNEVVVTLVGRQGTIVTASRSSIIGYEFPKPSSAQ
ncbi:MAG: VCBS repeat-containing protein, partial [Deltaproteobacteria bacterium]|nr:VCBS repeat-containing protein [Deltaproteobacteria bacterium]